MSSLLAIPLLGLAALLLFFGSPIARLMVNSWRVTDGPFGRRAQLMYWSIRVSQGLAAVFLVIAAVSVVINPM